MIDQYLPESINQFVTPLVPYGPYIVLLGSLTLLWLLGSFLSWIDARAVALNRFTQKQEDKQQTKKHSSSSSPSQATYLQQGFHIVGLSSDHLEELRVLIHKNDLLELAVFFARYQPSIKEIDDAIDSIQKQLEVMWDEMVTAEVKSEKLIHYLRSKNYKSKNLNCLSANDFRHLVLHEQKPRKIIDKDFIAKFGDLLFMENFIMYDHLCQSGNAVFHIPPDNDLRRMFTTFVKTGIATNGLVNPLKERMKILNLDELRSLAQELNSKKTFETVDEAINTLIRHEDTEFRFEKEYPSSDIYCLKKESWNIKAIEEEWSTYNVYAKLLSIQH